MGLQIPGRLPIKVDMQEGPNAVPQAFNIQGASGVQMMIFGGLTKLEQGALMVAAGAVAGQIARHELPMEACDLAEQVLSECRNRQSRPQTDPIGNGN